MSAIAALRGYRTQFLYSLQRILKDYDKGYVFNIEGQYEDLDILDEKRKYVESIQIKNKKGNLTFIDLFSKKDSFFKRAAKLISNNENVKIQIVSFSNVSEELIDTSKLAKKLKKKGFKDIIIEKIINNYQVPIIVDEAEIVEDILKRLKGFNLFTNPKVAIDLLLFWIYKSGENQIKITTKDLINDLNNIGKFISEQNSFSNQFGNTIIPINSKNLEDENSELLKKGFYYGISARYEHILADLDILRIEKLETINKTFQDEKIVFIHGASGQGKSTLAYRYLHDYSDKNTVYELKLSNNFNEILETVNSLEALSKGLKFPVTIYFDILPQNNYWNEILKELSTKTNLQFLVTIRQEDWNRTALGDDFNFGEIELNFDKKEAEIIYDALSEYKTDLKFTDFQESWLEFGNKGMLLEYVYLINQGDKLKIRLENQINNLEKERRVEELEILRYVCLSDAFNSKVNYKKIIDILNIDKSLSSSFIKLLEKEYLLKFDDNKKYLTGLHPIRSQLLCELLFDGNDYIEISDYINNSIALVDEQDLHFFLLNSFNKGYKVEELLEVLSRLNLTSWTGYINVFNALLWKGANQYSLVDNIAVFEEAYQSFKSAWWIFIVIDFTEMRSDNSILDVFELIHKNAEDVKEKRKKIESLTNRLTPKETVFDFCISWLNQISIVNIQLKDDREFKDFGEFLFWIGFLKKEIELNFDNNSLLNFFKDESCDLESKSMTLLGLKSINYVKSNNLLISDLESNFILSFRKEHNIPVFNDDGNIIELKYFFDITANLDTENLEQKPNNTELDDESNYKLSSESSNIFNEKSMEIIGFLRKAFPDRLKFKVNGVGYNSFGMDMEHYPTFKNISIENLPLEMLTRLNRLIINFFDYQKRLDTWEEYVAEVLKTRKNHINALIELRKGLTLYFKNNHDGINYFVDNESNIKSRTSNIEYQKLPKVITDKWCYYGDSTIADITSSKIAYSLSKYKKIDTSKRDYFTSVNNYINHSFSELVNTMRRLNGTSDEIENENLRNLSEVVLFDSFTHLVELQKEFQNRFKKYYDIKEIEKISETEINVLATLITTWKAFIYSLNKRIQPKILKLAKLNFEKTKLDFQVRLYKDFINHLGKLGYLHDISIDAESKKLFILINVNYENISNVILTCFGVILEIFGDMHHSSLKRLIVKLNFEKIIIVPLINGNPVHDKFYELSVSRIKILKEKILDDYQFSNIFEVFNFSDNSDNDFTKKYQVQFWNNLIPEITLYGNVSSILNSLIYLKVQIEEISTTFINLDKDGKSIMRKYYQNLSDLITNQITDMVTLTLDELKSNINYIDKDYSSEITYLDNIIILLKKCNTPESILDQNFNNLIIEIKEIEQHYNNFCKIMIDNYCK